MTLGPIGNLTPPHQASDADDKSVAEAHKAAQQFEAIFLRQLMGALEKTGGLGNSSKGGAGVLRSMMVTALADSTAEGGGIGLADVVFKAMLPPSAAAAPAATPPAAKTAAPTKPAAPAPAVVTPAALTTSGGS
jgi:flagellar protein FlgJ